MSRYNPVCSNCNAKSADCAYGDLKGSESCQDAIKRILTQNKEMNGNQDG